MRRQSVSSDPEMFPENLDALAELPKRNKRSVRAMLLVQAFNAFTDNFVKILLVALAGIVAKGTELGDGMQIFLGAIFSLPYILFAPVAGWMSDRFSKQRVIFWMQIAQVLAFLAFHVAFSLQDEKLSLQLALACFFLMATQSAFFSPAKMGIGKELVGSERLGNLTGKLQLTNFMGILGGMGIAGWWFGSLLTEWSSWQVASQTLEQMGTVLRPFDPASFLQLTGQSLAASTKPMLLELAWKSANSLLAVSTGIAMIQILVALLIQKTPSHPELKFHKGIWIEHLDHLRLMWQHRAVRFAALGVTFFWFISNGLATILVTLSREMHPYDASAAAKELSMMPAMLGIGVMLGSVVAGMISRKRLEMGLVPFSGLLMALSLCWTGFVPLAPWVYISLILVGTAGGAFMTPLYAFIQDQSKPEERARILSAVNLMDCVAAVVANMVMIKAFLSVGMPSAMQVLFLAALALLVTYLMAKLLPQGVLRLVGLTMVKSGYRLRVHHADRMPKEDGILLLSNHVSYVDTVMLGAASRRDLRFVMLESMYEGSRWRWFYEAFGSIPISPTKAKEALKTVAESLQNQEAVVLFPEGQLSRTGWSNPIRKGYELMARMGKSSVQIVWLDGLWHSVFAFKDGRALKKKPQAVPLPVSVYFGPILEVKDATPRRVRLEWMKLSAEAFSARLPVIQSAASPYAVALQNRMRLEETNVFQLGEVIGLTLAEDHPVKSTFHQEMGKAWGVTFTPTRNAVDKQLADQWSAEVDYVVWPIQEVLDPRVQEASARGQGIWLFDRDSGLLITASGPVVPNQGEEDQISQKPGTYGRILTGFSVEKTERGIRLKGQIGAGLGELEIEHVEMDDEGFLRLKNVEPAASI